ncbi:gamma-glutamyltransferase family protein [Mycolicibacterium agri]|nr:gamma-glutamyltransferase [Mycolicibacterium agri]
MTRQGPAVICPQPVVADAAMEVLGLGGNAVDAVVAGMAVQGVVDPLMCGLGGYGVMTVHEASTRRNTVLDFFARAPLAVEEGKSADVLQREFTYDYGFVVEGGHNEIGHRSVATPGTVAGMARALEMFGTMPWSAVLEPAAALAEEGFALTEAQRVSWYSDDGPDKPGGLARMAYSETGRALYTDDGKPLPLGHRVSNRDLANTLRHLMGKGAADFYRGELAEAMVGDLAAHESLLRTEDFEEYSVSENPPLTTTYRDTTLAFPGFPAGGVSILAALNLIAVLQPDDVPDWPTTDAITAVAQALQGALEDKFTYLAGSRDTEIPVQYLVSRDYARQRTLTSVGVADEGSMRALDDEPPSTTHIAVVDRDGNAASATHTLASGSGVISPGLGFMFNNFMHGYDPRPGKWNSLRPGATRPASMSPGLAFDGAGELIGVLGASGSTRIVTALVQVISHLVDRRWDPWHAVGAPRINVQLDGKVQCEGRIPTPVVRAIEASGRQVLRHLRNYDPYFGKVHVLWRTDGEARWEGAADPRGDGGLALVGQEVVR